LPHHSEIIQHPFFDLENAHNWIMSCPFQLWLQSQNAKAPAGAAQTSASALGKRNVIEISSSDESDHGREGSMIKSNKGRRGAGKL
jgi:hypothetical protein